MPNVVFMGSPNFAVPTLESLIEEPRFDLVSVVTQPDRPKGRGKRFTPTAVKERARQAEVPVIEMSKVNYVDVAREITRLEPDFIVVAAFGIILKADLLDLPRYGCVNLHASLLPRYRGVSPIQGAILAGESVTGCTTMLMDEGIDTGHILLSASTKIELDDTAGSIEGRLARIGAPLVIDTLHGLLDGTVQPTPQNDSQATYTKRIVKENGRIDWTRPAGDVDRQIRAMTPWPSAHTTFGTRRVIIVRASRGVDAETGGEPGEVIATEPLLVQTGEGTIEVERLKVEGKKEMPASAFLSGYRVGVGQTFS